MGLELVQGFNIRNLRVRSLDIDSKEVTWERDTGPSVADALDYTVEVLRSESPEGPYDLISPPFSDRYIFVDRRVPQGAKYVLLHYKLRVTHRQSGTVTEVGPAAQQAEPTLVAQYIRRMQLVYLTQVIGRSAWLFKKRTFGPRCPTCFDAKMNKRVADRCLDCFSTGMLRGYHDPIEIWVQIDPTVKTRQNNAQQIAEFVSATARTSFYPNIAPGDLLVEAENRRWRIQTVTTSEQHRAPIKQELSMRQIEEKDIEFKIPINVDRALRDIQSTPVRLFENAQDLNTAIENRTSDAFQTYMTYDDFEETDGR